MPYILLSLIIFSLVLNTVLYLGVWRLRSKKVTPEKSDDSRGISILKPLKGLDPALEVNLRSFFTLDWANYELIFGVASKEDPALQAVWKLREEFPEVACTVVISDARIGINPKVNNLANMLPAATKELILISDSNVRVQANYLRETVPLLDDKTGLVTCGFRAIGGKRLAEELEALQLHTFCLGGMAGGNRFFNQTVSVGKSMLMRRSIIEEIGGMEMLGQYLAEDQVWGLAIAKLGQRTVLADHLIDNVVSGLSLKDHFQRHRRWASIRFRLNTFLYIGEVHFNTLFFALLALAFAAFGSAWVGGVALLAMMVRIIFDGLCDHAVGSRTSFWKYFYLVPLRDFLMLGVWASGILTRSIEWRGKRYYLGRNTLLRDADSPNATQHYPSEETHQEIIISQGSPA